MQGLFYGRKRMLKQIELHGILAEKFGKYFELQVRTALEATHALSCMIPEFKAFMLSSEQKGIRYAVFLDEPTPEKNIGESQLDDITSAKTIHIMPKMMGAGGDSFGILQVVAGVAMIGVGLVNPAFLATGMNTALIGAGIGLTIGGAASLLMPNPKVEQQDPDGNRANYGFGGAVTTVAQGNPVPVLYGQRMVGGFVASIGIYTEDKQ